MADKLRNMDTEIFWQAVKTNDVRFDGAFVLGVKTTGIYCKPSCRARLPKRENVAFYESCGTAESNGFRACLRCRPKMENATDPQVKAILQACKLIDEHEHVSLDDGVEVIELLVKSLKLDTVGPIDAMEAIDLSRWLAEQQVLPT